MTDWVLLDETQGAKTTQGESLTPAILADIAEACTIQLNRDFAPEAGGSPSSVRAGASQTDIRPGEQVYGIVAALPNAPGDVAYHSTDGAGVPFALLAITTCDTLTGNGTSVSSGASHEFLEAEADPGCNRYADDGKGREHAIEVCDPVEVQSYPIKVSSGNTVYVSNFVIPRVYFEPNAKGPYSYMAKAGIAGAVDPPGPMQIAPSGGGNYDVERTSPTSEQQVFAQHQQHTRVRGTPRNPAKVAHWSSRASRRGARV